MPKSQAKTLPQPEGDRAGGVAVSAPALPKGKLGLVIELLSRKEGARIEELMTATGWQAHSVRGALSGAIKKKLGLNVASHKTDDGRVYRIDSEAAA